MTLLACSSLESPVGTQTEGTTAGGATAFSNAYGSIPMCNAADNRHAGQPESACTAADDRQHTIAFKIATKDDPQESVESGQTFFCQCGDAALEPVLEEETIAGELDEFQAIGIVSLNPTCIVWSQVGGLHCVKYI
jgi:hypothetical protein